MAAAQMIKHRTLNTYINPVDVHNNMYQSRHRVVKHVSDPAVRVCSCTYMT